MRWILCGDWRYAHHEAAIAESLSNRGISVFPFRYREYISDNIWGKIQNKILFGPAIYTLNHALRKYCSTIRPDVLFMRKPVGIWGSTVKWLRDQGKAPTIVTYNNDNPFDDGRRRGLWRHYHKVASLSDINYFFRPKDIEHAINKGWRKPLLFMPYYDPKLIELGRHEPIITLGAGFYGHFEPDGRDQYLEAVLDAGVKLTVIGPRWDELGGKSRVGEYAECRWLDANEYARYLAGTHLCLCFFSERNKDVYTTRVFEITAAGSVLLSQRSAELQKLFMEDVEAVFFSSAEELVLKLKWLLANPMNSIEIARRGQQRCRKDGHDVQSRIDKVIEQISQDRDGR